MILLRYLETLGLLPDLHGVLLPKLLLTPLVVLHLIGQLGLVLRSDQLGPGALHRAQLPELELLGGLVVPQQHGALQVLLGLLLIQLLKDGEKQESQRIMAGESRAKTNAAAVPPL